MGVEVVCCRRTATSYSSDFRFRRRVVILVRPSRLQIPLSTRTCWRHPLLTPLATPNEWPPRRGHRQRVAVAGKLAVDTSLVLPLARSVEPIEEASLQELQIHIGRREKTYPADVDLWFSASAYLERSNHFVFLCQVLFVFNPSLFPSFFLRCFLPFFLSGFLLFHARTMSNNDPLRRPMACLCMPRSRDDKIQCSALFFSGQT